MRALLKAASERIQNEPVLVLGVVQASVALGVSFGLNWSGEQTAAVVTFSAAVLGVIARQQVTPTRTLVPEPFPQVELTDGGLPTEG